jgi:para-aminobenzoate synthetase component 1
VLDVAGDVRGAWDDPLGAIRHLTLGSRGTWVGYFSYDCGRMFEVLPAGAIDDLNVPLFAFMQFGEVPTSPPMEPARSTRANCRGELRSTFDRHAYIEAVERVLEYIRAGDAYQINLSQRFTVPLLFEPIEVYRRLQSSAPATYGAFLDFGDLQIISNSPELFLRVEPMPDGRRRVVTRPVKGTRPRLPGMDLELRDSEKDKAELAMIVDLERNDLGRVCEIGSIRVIEPRAIEEHPTVYHGVATIEGILRDDITFVDLLRATFPGGSVTGAPKIRAMQIIDELEPVRRGPYCGAIGYISSSGVIELNIAIRTMIVKDGLVHIPVGGGIVADSDPTAEYEETLVKAKAMFAAVGIEKLKPQMYAD